MEFLFQLLNTRGVKSKKVSAEFSKILSNITCADLSKMSETMFLIWILENVKQFCKWFFSLDLKQVSFFTDILNIFVIGKDKRTIVFPKTL